MLRWARTLSLLAALSPTLVLAATAPSVASSVRVLKGSGPYHRQPARLFQSPRVRAPIAPRIGRVLPPAPTPRATLDPGIAALARARACKVFDRNLSGIAEAGEPMVKGWRFRLSRTGWGAKVRATDWDGCATFTGLRPGRYALTELSPPFWDAPLGGARNIDVLDPRGQDSGAAPTIFSAGGCVHFARLGSSEFWRGRPGLRLLDDRDRRLINALAPFRSPSGSFAAGDEPFDGLFSNGVTRVRGATGEYGAWGPGTWEAELSLYLGDRGVSANPRGRLAQEILVFALNARHFLERAQVVILEDAPIFVDDLIFEAILAWHGDSPSWNHEMTALLAAINGTEGLAYVPRDQCQVAYLPF